MGAQGTTPLRFVTIVTGRGDEVTGAYLTPNLLVLRGEGATELWRH